MEPERIAEVHAGEYGTGYLVAPGLILTAAHVIANPGAIVVRFLDDGTELPGELAWPGNGLDAAPIRVDRTLPPTRWGRLVPTVSVPAEMAGFPAAQRLAGRRRGTDRLTGALDPLAGAPHHIEFKLTEAAPSSEAPDPADSPYDGRLVESADDRVASRTARHLAHGGDRTSGTAHRCSSA